MDTVINNLVEIGAVAVCEFSSHGFLSSYFLLKKSEGGNRFVLNLKKLNDYLIPPHFKLDDYRAVKNLMTPGCYMTSIDLKDAYFGIPIHKNYQKYLRFKYKENIYEFKVLPFGLSVAPYIFTKILRPVTQYLKAKGILIINYLDDFILFGDTAFECARHLELTIVILQKLGFIINYKKCNLIPSQTITFLGFLFNSKELSFSVPEKKIVKIKNIILSILRQKLCKIRRFAGLVGTLISICPAVAYGYLYTKIIERKKYLALKREGGNYNKYMIIDSDIKKELNWWLKSIPNKRQYIKHHDYSLVIYSDASSSGWGIYCNKEKIHGFWTGEMKKYHINYLELMAAFIGLKSFAKYCNDCSVLLRIDNTTAISYVNKMGGIKYPHLASLARRIWQWCERRNIFIFASYIESCLNKHADMESRSMSVDTEYSLNSNVFQQIVVTFGSPEVDLFASVSNAKCNYYVSWKRDPDSIAVDAFTIKWSYLRFYAFPPFSIISRVLQKIILDKAEGIVVIPLWKAQCWYPLFRKMLIDRPLIFPPNQTLLISPFLSSHPLWPKITLVAGMLSGKHMFIKDCH